MEQCNHNKCISSHVVWAIGNALARRPKSIRRPMLMMPSWVELSRGGILNIDMRCTEWIRWLATRNQVVLLLMTNKKCNELVLAREEVLDGYAVLTSCRHVGDSVYSRRFEGVLLSCCVLWLVCKRCLETMHRMWRCCSKLFPEQSFWNLISFSIQTSSRSFVCQRIEASRCFDRCYLNEPDSYPAIAHTLSHNHMHHHNTFTITLHYNVINKCRQI